MLEIILSNRFKKDLKLIAKRGYNLDLLNDVVELLARQEPLPDKNRDHSLTFISKKSPTSIGGGMNCVHAG